MFSSSHFKFDDLPTQYTKVDQTNLHQTLMASGSIPLVLRGVKDINNAPHGIYRDGGIIDYHLDLPLAQASEGLVLYPHFFPVIKPGWFDKNLKSRHAKINNFDKLEVGKGIETPIKLEINGEWTEVKWFPEYGLSCSDCTDPFIIGENDQSYTVAVINKTGCSDEMTFNLAVISTIDFYVPNIISSKATDEKNHCFYIQSRDDLKYKYALNIYDRYGNLIYTKEGLLCNDSQQGWLPKNINPGVFVYRIEFEADIDPKVISGTITVIE